MSADLEPIRAALAAGNKGEARRRLKAILKTAPSADGWVLAARAMESEAQAITCLKKAIALDPWHTGANRLLLRLESVESVVTRQRAADTDEASVQIPEDYELPPAEKRKTRLTDYQRQARRRQRLTRLGCMMSLLFMVSCTLFTFSLIGVIPGVIGAVTRLTGGPSPVTQIDNVPVQNVPFAAATIEPAQSKETVGREVDVIDHGYVHEYTFDARQGEEYLGYVQFMSLAARDVGQNVVILDPDGQIAPSNVCIYLGDQGLLGGRGNVSFECRINKTGTWSVRLLGISGESVGAYFIGVERLGF